MKTESANWPEVAETLEALRREVTRLGERVAALEKSSAPKPPTPAPVPVAQAEGLSEEILLVLSAAIAAFLGKKAHIRQIRLIGATAWAQQGRVTIQASHALSTGHTRSPQ